MDSHPAPGGGADSNRFGPRFALGSALIFVAVSVAMTWPMAIAPDALYSSRQDYYLNLWNLWWVARAGEGGGLFHTTLLMHPLGTGLEGQPLSLLQTVAAIPVTRWLGPVVAYNLLAVFAFWLAGWSASLWIARLSGDGFAGIVGGLVFSFAPFHFVYLPELNLVATGLVPLWFLGAHAWHARPSITRAALTGLALAAVALSSWYYAVAVGLVAVAASVRLAWAAASRDRARVAASIAAHWAVAALLLAPVLFAMVPAFAGAPESWGRERAGLDVIMSDFKGSGTTVGLAALVGWSALALAAFASFRPRGRAGLLGLGVVFAVLALGSSIAVAGVEVPLPFALLERVPVLRAFRYPDRFFVVALLALAALSGMGAADLRARRRGVARGLVTAVLVLVPLVEAWPGMLASVSGAPALPVPARGRPGAVLHVPTTLRNLDGESMYLQTGHERALCGGYLTRPDESVVAERRADRAVGPAFLRRPPPLGGEWVQALREAGIAFVVLQRRPSVASSARPAGAVMGPFALSGGRAFLHRRLFPSYPLYARLAEAAAAWHPALERELGAPVSSTPEWSVYEVPAR